MPNITILTFFLFCALFSQINCKSEQGKYDFVLTDTTGQANATKSLFAGSRIIVQIICDSKFPDAQIKISWALREHPCYIVEPNIEEHRLYLRQNNVTQFKSVEKTEVCSAGGQVEVPAYPYDVDTDTDAVQGSEQKLPNEIAKKPAQASTSKSNGEIYTITKDGIYEFELMIQPVDKAEFKASVHVEVRGPHGYLSAVEWPLLPFFGIMCLVYVIFGIIWLVVSFMQWRDLLRIQFWIGGVIFLGMLEKAFFYAEYQTMNSTGMSGHGGELAAEFVSCAKRTLARMLVIIMSLGFGIVKPRLGPMLHRVVGVGLLYFILACVESYLRVMRTKTDGGHELVDNIPLTVLEAGICWWIFTSLVQTTRTLRLRRNTVKLTLYRHFTNTLIFSVLVSVIFMLYSIRQHRTKNCSPGWRGIWIDIAFWHILFSILLLVIMILWRPTNNNQRYAFTPLLDSPEDEDEDDEEDQFVADAYGVKMRGVSNGSRTPSVSKATTNEEDDLRWVEENIPSSMAEPTLPVLDSDEEIINTKFEVSKMQ